MFTGIIEAVGQITAIVEKSGDRRLSIAVGKLDMSDINIGDSIACNGVCLTVVAFDQSHYVADVSAETLNLTTLGRFGLSHPVNLEKALRLSDRLGGHLVSGHVDGVGEIIAINAAGSSQVYRIKAPTALAKYIAKKGSITLDGVSLTVNQVKAEQFELNLVPHTLIETTLKDYRVGTQVNLEVDLIARYLERLVGASLEIKNENEKKSLDYQTLMNSGFIR